MIKAVLQACDWCSKEASASGMRVPDGWVMCDLRGGLEPGINGYAWNVCGADCLLEMIGDWKEGKNPLPYGMHERSQVIQEATPPPTPTRRRSPEIDMLARASAQMAENGHAHSVPIEQQGMGGH